MSINKNFVVKNGLEVDVKTLYVDAVNNRVGVGTTIPTSDFEVDGNANIKNQIVSKFASVGISTFATAGISTLTATTIVATAATFTSAIFGSLSISGNSSIGDATNDTVTINAQVASNLDPATTDIYDLGNAKRWRDLNIARTINATTFIGSGSSVGVSTVGFITATNAFISGVSTVGTALSVTGPAKFAGNVAVTGVSTFTGDTLISGFSTVSKAAIFSSDVNVSGATTVGTALSVTGPTKLNTHLAVTGVSTFFGDVLISGFSTISKAAIFSSDVNVSGATTVGTALSVTGPAKFAGNVAVTGVSTFTGTVNAGFITASNAYISGVTTVGTLNFDSIGGSAGATLPSITNTFLSVSGVATINQANITRLSVTGVSTFTGDTLISGFSTVSKAAIFSSDVNVSGVSTVGTALSVTGPAKFAGNVAVTGVSTFTGDTLISGFSTVSKAAIFSSNVNVSGATTVGTALSVIGPTKLNTHLAVTGVSTFSGDVLVSGIATVSNGPLIIGAASSTGTASQPLQVTGGAYVSGNLGIGTTNPSVALQLSPNASISNVGSGITLAGTVGSALTVAQFFYSNTNSSYLRIKATRNTDGSNWLSASTKLINITDVTEQGYIEYNPNGSLSGMAFGTGVTEWARFLSGGNLGIGTTNPTSKLHVVGDVLVTGITTSTDFNSSSDINLKDNIRKIENPIDKVLQLDGVTFNWKSNQRPSVGVIAQQVEKVLPQLVSGDYSKTVNYNGLIGLLIECIKEQQNEIDAIKKKLQ